jgi:hypothetical protein
VDVGPALVTDGEAAESMKPGERPLHDPAVAAESLARLHPASRDSRGDASVSAGPSAAREVVALVGVELRRPLAWRSTSTAHGPHAIEQLLKLLGVVLVRRAKLNREGKPARVYQHMVLRARFAAIRSEPLGPEPEAARPSDCAAAC